MGVMGVKMWPLPILALFAPVVVSGGLITPVGVSVEVPADAWVIDGKGLTVYPGLIDALTDLGLTAATGTSGTGGAPGGGPARPAATTSGERRVGEQCGSRGGPHH